MLNKNNVLRHFGFNVDLIYDLPVSSFLAYLEKGIEKVKKFFVRN